MGVVYRRFSAIENNIVLVAETGTELNVKLQTNSSFRWRFRQEILYDFL